MRPDNARIAAQLRAIAKAAGELQHEAANLTARLAYQMQDLPRHPYELAMHGHLIGYHLRGAQEELEALAWLIERPSAPELDPAGAAEASEG